MGKGYVGGLWAIGAANSDLRSPPLRPRQSNCPRWSMDPWNQIRPETAIGMADGGEDQSRVGSLASISRGASLYTIGKVISDVGEFLLHLLVSRLLGAASYGLFAYGKTLAFTALLVTNLGSDESILKHLPQYKNEPRKRRFMLGLAWATSAGGGLIVSGALFLLAPIISDLTLSDPQFVSVLRLFAAVLFIDTLAALLYSTFRAVQLVEYEVLTKRILKPVLRVFGVGGVIAVGGSLYGVVTAMVVASVVTFAVAVLYFLRQVNIRPTLRSPGDTRGTVREYYGYSLPLTAKEAGTVMQGRVDVLMVGFLLSSTAVGVYNVSVLVAGVLYVPLLAVNRLFPPVASRLYTERRRADLTAIYSVVTRWTLTASLLIAVVVVVFRVEILALFGTEFTAGTVVLTLFVVSQLWNCATGPSGYLLMMTDHQYVVMATEWLFGVANVVLNYVFIQAFGLVGAALASAGVLAARNVTKIAAVWYFERLHPYSSSFVKPLMAAVVAAAGALVVEATLSGVPAVAVGSVVAAGCYGIVLAVAGTEPVDREVYRLLTASPDE